MHKVRIFSRVENEINVQKLAFCGITILNNLPASRAAREFRGAIRSSHFALCSVWISRFALDLIYFACLLVYFL